MTQKRYLLPILLEVRSCLSPHTTYVTTETLEFVSQQVAVAVQEGIREALKYDNHDDYKMLNQVIRNYRLQRYNSQVQIIGVCDIREYPAGDLTKDKNE